MFKIVFFSLMLASVLIGSFNSPNQINTFAGSDSNPNSNFYPNYLSSFLDKDKIIPLYSDQTKNNTKINLIFFINSEVTLTDSQVKAMIDKALNINKDYTDPLEFMGTFNIEPYRTNLSKFNFWIYKDKI